MSTSSPSLSTSEWPKADRDAWEQACRPGSRFTPGGAASRLTIVSRTDYANRYGAFLGFLRRAARLNCDAEAAHHINPDNVSAYLADLPTRVTTVTAYNAISKLRRVGKLLAPSIDLQWLNEIEGDLRLVATPRPKFDRLVMTDRLVEAGLALIVESTTFARTPLTRAKGTRNGLMIALLALCPIRLKNFAALEIARTLREIEGSWWIILPAKDTKSRRADERRLPDFLKANVEMYLSEARPVLLGSNTPNSALGSLLSPGRV